MPSFSLEPIFEDPPQIVDVILRQSRLTNKSVRYCEGTQARACKSWGVDREANL
jgi:hypothetical protein